MDDPHLNKRWPVKRIIAITVLIALVIGGVFLYNNFNRLLAEALMKSFNANIASDVYELKFEKLTVNIFDQSLRVTDLELHPRQQPLRNYHYINSSFQLKADKVAFLHVELFELLQSNKLSLEQISITNPEIEVLFESLKPVFLPFKDSTTAPTSNTNPKKRAIDAFGLKEFQLINATIHVINSAKQRQFEVTDFNIALNNLLIGQKPGEDLLRCQNLEVAIGKFSGNLIKGPVRHVEYNDLQIGIDSLNIQKTLDTLIFHLDDFRTAMKSLDVQTADSLFHLTMQSYELSYKKKSIRLGRLSFKPNITDAEMQKRFHYQHVQISGSADSVVLLGINFDSLMYYKKLLIDQVIVDHPEISIFKDKTKPMDKNRFPIYPGQQINQLSFPIRINEVKVTNVEVHNTERKLDSAYAKVNIQRGTARITNITNLSKQNPLTVIADAYVENKVHFNTRLDFSYQQPQFNLSGNLGKFNLPDLNPVLLAYSPASINKGIADEIAFSGVINSTSSTGTMKFLYHDLDVNLQLHEKAQWKSSILTFAANSVVHSSNPASDKLPPRVVTFHADRDMNKSFVNIIIRSIMDGIKETMFMSKENKQAYKEAKRQMKESSKE